MNWRRIFTGGLLAGIVFMGLDYAMNHLLLGHQWLQLQTIGYIDLLKPLAIPFIVLIDCGIGFTLMWFYALVRPRLGPGPRTAFLSGSIAWFLLYVPRCLYQWLWFKVPAIIPVVWLAGGLLQCWIGTYLAGWQYIEKAP